MKTKREKFEVVGSITVDAGLIQVGDPCYQYGQGDQDEWMNYLRDTGIAEGGDVVAIPHSREGGNYDGCSKAIALSSGLGDGIYDVQIKRCSQTGAIREMKIKFF